MAFRDENESVIGEADCFLQVLERVSQIAPLPKPVLIIGERGTGKELIAARVHFLSERWEQPFVKFNCAALNEELLESELFGHVAGAYTGASRGRVGRFELADGGTIFLDELASMSTRLQEKLLRVIESGEYERVGSAKPCVPMCGWSVPPIRISRIWLVAASSARICWIGCPST